MSKSKKEKQSLRPPVVTVMGHVDHGKTSILDAIRETKVQVGESGGITQHIGAYSVDFKGSSITFIDTPGHEAFSQMRARGGSVADIVVLVVSAVDGVKPQTREAITHAKTAGVPIVVAINKIDLSGADASKIKQQLTKEDVLVEGYGGDVVCVEVSATKRTNLDKLLEIIVLVAELKELQGDPTAKPTGVVIESSVDPNKGPIATVVVRDGSLHVGDDIVVGGSKGRVKALIDSNGKRVKVAGPSTPVEVLGLKPAPKVGDRFGEVTVEEAEVKKSALTKTPDGIRTLKIVLKADTAGTLEALSAAIAKLETPESIIKVLYSGVGDITDSDVLLAKAGEGMITGFKVRLNSVVKVLAGDNKVEVWLYDTIYELLEDLELALAGLLEMQKLQAPGEAEVLKLFPLPSGDVVVGCGMLQGVLKLRNKVEVVRDEEVVHTAKINRLRSGKDKIKRVEMGEECGMLLKPSFEVQVGDIIRIPVEE